MRTIKFRGKRVENGQWIYGDLYHAGETTCICDWSITPHSVENFAVDPVTVGQFTGLKDKNGNGVYEGDIFKDSDGVLRSIFRVPGGLAFEDNPVAFGYDHRAPVYPYSPLAESQNEAWISQCCEVIGNIHDNPELLKGGEQ